MGLLYGTFHGISLDELNIKQTAAKFVPRLLTDNQKHHQLEVLSELQEQVRNDGDSPFKVVAGDAGWIYGYDPETK
jgi:hypothetical protein